MVGIGGRGNGRRQLWQHISGAINLIRCSEKSVVGFERETHGLAFQYDIDEAAVVAATLFL
jgi:hypothetical protein